MYNKQIRPKTAPFQINIPTENFIIGVIFEFRLINDENKTDQQKFQELDYQIQEVLQTSKYSTEFQNHWIIVYEQRKLELLFKANRARVIDKIYQIQQQIVADNPNVFLYVLSENLRRDQGRNILLMDKSSKIGLESILFPQAQNYNCFKLRMRQRNFKDISSKERMAQFIFRKMSQILQMPENYVKVVDITEGSIVVHFQLQDKTELNKEEERLLYEVFGGQIEVYNYFFGNNQQVGLAIDDFSPNYNMAWGYQFKEYEQRGPSYHRYDYYFPRGYNGYALNVLDGRYGQDKKWIAMDGNDGEWRILYHGTKQEYMANIVRNGLMAGNRQAHQNDICDFTKQLVNTGIYFSDRVSICEQYTQPTQVGNKQFLLVFQSRVNPKAIRQSSQMKFSNYFVVNDSKDIHPYRMLLKEV